MKLIKTTTTTTKINNQPRLLLVNTTWTDQHRRQAFSQFSEFSYFLTEKPWRREGQVIPWKNEERPGDEMVEGDDDVIVTSWRRNYRNASFRKWRSFALSKKTSESQVPEAHRVSIIWCDCYWHNNFFSVFSPVFLFGLAFKRRISSHCWTRGIVWQTHDLPITPRGVSIPTL